MFSLSSLELILAALYVCIMWTHIYASHRADLHHQHHQEYSAVAIKSDCATKNHFEFTQPNQIAIFCFNPSSHPMLSIFASTWMFCYIWPCVAVCIWWYKCDQLNLLNYNSASAYSFQWWNGEHIFYLPIFIRDLNSRHLIVLREACCCDRVTWHQINGGFEIGMLEIWGNRFFMHFQHLSFDISRNIFFSS